ncbi:MAG: hypothetical protein FWG27_01250 [Treponema sp.]|nr:hypothetical protein [Treponema sp.]
MKSIQQKILVFVVLPFLAIYMILSAVIFYQAYNHQIDKAAKQLHTLAVYNESNLRKLYEILELAVMVCAAELETIDGNNPNAREMGETIIVSRFHNSNIIYAWLAFEPHAFDGNDNPHTEEYPPSGRFIRSFARNGNSWKITNDINETDLKNQSKSHWYIIPRDTGILYSDLGSDETFWDYGSGSASSFGISAPIFRNKRIIGCVGLNAALNEKTLGDEIFPEMVSAIFLPGGTVGYSLKTEILGKTLEELGFTSAGQIRMQMEEKKPIYLYGEHSKISGVKSYNYFYPVQIKEKIVYLHTSLPLQEVWKNTFSILLPIATSLTISLVIFLMLLLYFSRGIAAPLKKLIIDSEDLVTGNLDKHIEIVHSHDEMEMISKSLSRMAEQFKASKLLQERYRNRYDIILRIHYSLFRSPSLSEAINATLIAISEYYSVYKAALVFMIKNHQKIVASYPSEIQKEETNEFIAHDQMVNLLEGKKYLTMNSNTLEAAKLSFVAYNTKSLCILPLRIKETLNGYIILEGKETEALIHDDTTLLYLGDTLCYLLNYRANWEQELSATAKQNPSDSFAPGENGMKMFMPENTDTFLEKAKTIQNLNVERGILLIGDEKEKYTELLKVTIKTISDVIIKLRRFHTGDLHAFAIEIHGIKGSLYSIGNEALGDEARQLEFAAKSDDAEYCKENYPFFEEKLRTFSRNLAALFPQREQNYHKGNVQELAEILIKAREACNNFDISAVNSILSPLSSLKWDNETIQKHLQNIFSDMENLEYDGMAGKISHLLGIVKDKEP